MVNKPKTINTRSGKNDGLNKCPNCGSAEIFTLPEGGQLQCQHCRTIFFPPPAVSPVVPSGDAILSLATDEHGTQVVQHSGAADIDPNLGAQVTIECQGCGAEVVVNTDESMHARCHWCRQILSLENQMPNGAVPDVLLPFHLSKEQARASIEEFVKKRTFFANKQFKREFTTENVLGVYLPYFVIDTNTHCQFQGNAGQIARRYSVKIGDSTQTRYDIDVYQIARDFDLEVSGLTFEARSEKRNTTTSENTNNIINSIMPFDIENVIPYNGNYLKGFTSERRDTNVEEVKYLADSQIQDIARYQANATAAAYDAGTSWNTESVDKKGIVWRTAYLPVWLYSYLEKKKNGKHLLHYVAVNARTGETMGSVPVDKKRLLIVSLIVEAIAVPIGILMIIFGGYVSY